MTGLLLGLAGIANGYNTPLVQRGGGRGKTFDA
jgi:hypothetical protein